MAGRKRALETIIEEDEPDTKKVNTRGRRSERGPLSASNSDSSHLIYEPVGMVTRSNSARSVEEPEASTSNNEGKVKKEKRAKKSAKKSAKKHFPKQPKKADKTKGRKQLRKKSSQAPPRKARKGTSYTKKVQ